MIFQHPLPLARYRVTAQAQQPLPLPHYAGSLLRGPLGAALRSMACMTRLPACPGCPLLATCPYSRIFEAPPPAKGQHQLQDFSNIPNPYVIEPPTPGARVLAAGETLQFHLVLVGHAVGQLPLLLFALQRALAQGLTRQRIPLSLQQVDWLDTQGQSQSQSQPIWNQVWSQAAPTVANHPSTLQVPTPPAPCNSIALHIHTPMRLQQQSIPLGLGQLSPRALVAAVVRRAALLMEFHAGQNGWGQAARHITQQSETLQDTQHLRWFDWTRYSSRQQQEMTLGGVVGQWTLHGPSDTLTTLWPWLWLGQWLHVGKNATMGMGGYTLLPALSTA